METPESRSRSWRTAFGLPHFSTLWAFLAFLVSYKPWQWYYMILQYPVKCHWLVASVLILSESFMVKLTGYYWFVFIETGPTGPTVAPCARRSSQKLAERLESYKALAEHVASNFEADVSWYRKYKIYIYICLFIIWMITVYYIHLMYNKYKSIL